jgi:transcription antitermination factor NusG
MPILPSETSLFPDELFELHTPWVVAHVRSRQEKRLARHLLQHGVPFYLPLTSSHRDGRHATSFLPLLPGYVFLRSERAERTTILSSQVVVRLIAVPDEMGLGEELQQIRKLQLGGASLQPHHGIKSGDAVVIREGAFRGYKGRLLREIDGDRLLIEISIIQRSIVAEYSPASVKKLP